MNKKKGISLIVLIVTIIVIIILAAAVILTLNQNNPIDSSRVAQLSDNRASINSAVSLYYGKQMAATQGIYDANQIFTLTDVSDEHKTLIGDALVTSTDSIGSYYVLSNGENSTLGITIPTVANATWYLDVNSGLVYLGYKDSASIPSWMLVNGDMDSTLKEFVRVEGTDADNNKILTNYVKSST